MKKELSSKYDSKQVESGKYEKWVKNGYFIAGKDKSKPAFSIVIPPPNVTGKLHLGHAWDVSIQDLIVRYKRMRGFDVLWVPGCDHAGIATQAKVEEKLRAQGISRYDLGREKFVQTVWDWKDEYANTIHQQWAKLGVSVDYTRERFTLDKGLNDAVKKVFVTLYNEGLIYRGERIINWDTKMRTALSNIEVIYKETESSMYYFKYYLDKSDQYLEVATTRPETMFGDVCVVVNPNDERYKDLIGKNVINPANGNVLPIVGDEYVDIEFGTGAMKCTPAHDPNDFIIGEKYGFPKIKCMNDDGTMNDVCKKYAGLDRFECRKELVNNLKNDGLLIKIEKHINQVGYSERSNTIVEPYLSKQWFVKMKPLAQRALDNQKTDDKVNFYPERFEHTFENWMNGIEDWCISRQLWWGHNIPAWYHKQTGEVYVDVNPPKDIENYVQDEDVLDTWFSSGLWPFSTLGWPNTDNEDYKRYYPTSVLVTGYDIIFFWVSRMIFQGLKFTNRHPFNDCLLHGLIRDSQGRKMSKSLGNGVDPMDVIDTYGDDALRYFLLTNSAPGLDLRYSEEKIKASWNFINKIWNASRYVMMNLDDDFVFDGIDANNLSLPDKFIISKLNMTVEKMTEFIEKYEFVIAGNYLYNFIYDDFCSWYLEMSKLTISTKATKNTLFYILDNLCRLIHPFMPFVSEEIYQTLHNSSDISICEASWPTVNNELVKDYNGNVMTLIIETIKTIRNTRSEMNIAPNKLINATLVVKDNYLSIKDYSIYIERFGFISNLNITDKADFKENGKTFTLVDGNILFLPLASLININDEIKRLELEIVKYQNEIKRCESMLSNENFVKKAPASKIKQEEDKLRDYQNKLNSSKKSLENYKKVNN